MNRIFAIAAAAALMISTVATATEDIADMQARIAALEAKMMAPAASGDAESLMSLKKKGQVKIGGETKITLRYLHQDERNVGNAGPAKTQLDEVHGSDTMNYTTWDWEASLNFKVEANADTYLFWKLDLEDADDSDDLVEEVGIHFKNVRGSNWDVIIGKDEMPFGQDCCRLITDPYVHGGSTLMGDANMRPNANDGANGTLGATNPHATVGFETNWAGEIDNAIGIQAHYKYKDLAKLELAVFQNSDGENANGNGQIGMFEDKSEDQLQSYAARLWLYPQENLKMQVSYMTRHLESMADEQGSSQFREEDEHALSAAFTYKFGGSLSKLDVYGEYIYNWNMDYKSDLSAHVFQLGAGYALTPKISLQGWWEMARVNNGYARHNEATAFDNIGTTYADVAAIDPDAFDKDLNETWQRIGLGATYTMDCGIQFIGEYLYEWYQNDAAWYKDADAHSLAFRTYYEF